MKKKRDHPPEDINSGREIKKHLKKIEKFVIDLADVPPQLPILKSKGRIKEGASKYMGVSFHKPRNKWRVIIMIEGKHCHVGSYESEEEAAVNYARAVFKYQGQEALAKAREGIDLSDVPPQPPIPKSGRYIKDCSSKYTGVSFDKSMNKWQAKIWMRERSDILVVMIMRRKPLLITLVQYSNTSSGIILYKSSSQVCHKTIILIHNPNHK